MDWAIRWRGGGEGRESATKIIPKAMYHSESETSWGECNPYLAF